MVIDKIKEIEENFDVKKILINNEFAWPVLRTYVAGLLYHKEDRIIRNQAITSNKLFNFIRSFMLGIPNLLIGQFDYLYFSKAERRKSLDGYFQERILEEVMALHADKSLLIESPVPINHYPSEKINTKNISSESFLYFIQGIIMLFQFRNKYSGIEILTDIEEKYSINIDYKYILKRFQGQYISLKILLKIKKPKAGFFVAPSLYMGYVKAFKEHGIPTVEFQHGVINDKHFAYNIFHNIEPHLLPDYLLAYGQNTVDFLTQSKRFIDPKNIFPVGYYYLERIAANPIQDLKLTAYKKNYRKIICFSGHEEYEDEIINFLKKVVLIDPTISIAYVPRVFKDYNHYELPDNIVIVNWINVYDTIISCDLHSTMLSSCAFEAPILGRQNILVDINKNATKYFAEILCNEFVTKFSATPDDYVLAVNNMPKLSAYEIKQSLSHMFTPNHRNNIIDFFGILKIRHNA